MALGTALFLIALGAILKYAVADTIEGVELGTIGVILMIVGAIGALLSLILWAPWSRQREDVVVRDRYVDRPPPPPGY